MDGWMEKLDELTNIGTDGWMNRYMVERMDGWRNWMS